MKKRYLFVALAVTLSACGQTQQSQSENEKSQPDYLNMQLSIDARVADLVGRMTIDEKIAQMYNDAPAIERLGIPAYDYWNEALHGVARAGKATVFPQAIGMAAMWDGPLLHDIATAISDEGRAKHHFFVNNDARYRYTGLTYWSPNINIFRDPRWGRGQETYGEDPYLTGELGIQFIEGLQGDDPNYLKTAATAKHFAVHNGPEISRHSDNYVVSDKDLYETYLPAFEKAVVEANVEAVMCAYNRVNGLPACGSDMLLKEILRGKYQFDGHVMSDCGAIADFYDPQAHGVVKAPAVAAAWAVTSGTDLNCGTGRLSTFANLHFALQKGLISEALIDQAVSRLFKTRFKLGMFDSSDAVKYAAIPMDVVGSQSHLSLTQTAAEKSLVLLKNNGVLPLNPDIKVAVIGPNADNEDVLLGNYNGLPVAPVTPLEAIKEYLGEDKVSFAPGSPVIADIYGHYEPLNADVLSHVEDGERRSGLVGRYYRVSHELVNDFTDLAVKGKMTGDPVKTRIDNAIDFYWERSPIDDKVLSEFGVVWEGKLTPKTAGEYRFSDDATIYIEGEKVEGTVALEAGKAYAFKAERLFLKNPWGNTIPNIRLSWVNTSVDLQKQALLAAEKADVIVVMAGISPRIEGEEMPVKLDGFNYGDRTDIDLPDIQQALIKKLKETGKPVVLVNFSGSAMALNWENDNLDAIVQAFYPGEKAGTAITRVLWGEANPSGRLPVTFYRNLDGIADFDDYAMTNRTYRYFEGDVLYPFGHGLSYSDFQYSSLKLPETHTNKQPLTIEVDVTNNSDFAGEEVSQVYVSMPDAPVKTPRRELKGFTRTAIEPGASKTVAITIDADELTYVDGQGNKQPYTGTLVVSVGGGQPDYLSDRKYQQRETVLR